jgi:hypothetical protein
MRVATVFTGAAAAAVGFAPAALAAPGHAAAQAHPARANGKAQAMAPDANSIRSAGCTTNTWVHIEYSELFRTTLCRAVGFEGRMKLKSADLAMYAQCGGNNVGTIYYSGGKSLSYAQGTTYRPISPTLFVSSVSILYWKGTEQCAWPR